MHFISFIASSMLLVLINQHSIMGLPVKTTVGKVKCSEGFEMVNGKCLPIDSVTTGVDDEISPETSKDVVIHEDEPVTELSIPKKSGACPEGMEHGEHGICQKLQPSKITKVIVKSTTDQYENSGGVETIKGCPEGTEADEQGACQEIKPSKPKKLTTNPKALLKEDGSCPDNYKMIEGQCLYIKSKTNSTVYPDGSTVEESVSIIIRPKSSTDEISKVELVPVLSDNSCPEGTEYSEYGLCQKQNHRSNSNLHMKSDGSCPDDFELINGKCTYKSSKVQGKLDSTTTPKMMRTLKSTTPAEDATSEEEFSTSTYSTEPDNEPKWKSTSTPKMMRMLKSTTPAVNANSDEESTTSTVKPDRERPLKSTTTTSNMIRKFKSTTPAEDVISKEQFSTSTSTAEPDNEPKLESTTITPKTMRMPKSTTSAVDTTTKEEFSTSTFTAEPEHEQPSEFTSTTSNIIPLSEITTPALVVITKEEFFTSATTEELKHEAQSETTFSPL